MAISSHSVEAHTIEESLCALLEIEEARAGNTGLREKLIGLQTKLATGQLHLAVLGQMKRGKSSFINALLGADVLPTGVLPVTAIITEIRYGPLPQATVIYKSGSLRECVPLNTLADYITEDGNPGNTKQVASVEISYSSPFLKDGVVLIDTPGIGSTHAHNTLTTDSYLEHVDAGIVVFSVDPPITEVESQFLRRITESIPRLFFVMNKTDIASVDELATITSYLRDELNRLHIASPEIFPLSARRALHGRRGSLAENGRSTGLEAFEDRLRTFLINEKREVLVRSVALDAVQISRALRFAASIGIRAQAMSQAQLHAKQAALDQILKKTQIGLAELQIVLRQRSADILAEVEHHLKTQVETHVAQVRRDLNRFQAQHRNETGRRFGALLEDFLMREIESVFHQWRIQEDNRVQAQLNELSLRFVAQVNGIIEGLEKSAGALFEIPIEHLSISCPLHVESRLHYRVDRVFYSLDSFLLLFPRFLLRPLVLRRINRNIPLLLDMNSGRIRYDYVERLQASISHFEKNLCAPITTIIDALNSILLRPAGNAQQQAATLSILDSVVSSCTRLLK